MPATDHHPDFASKARLFGDKVRAARAELDLSERQLAEKAGLSRGYISLLLKDRGSHKGPDGSYKLPNPTLDVIWKLADALELDATYLIDNDRPVESRKRRR